MDEMANKSLTQIPILLTYYLYTQFVQLLYADKIVWETKNGLSSCAVCRMLIEFLHQFDWFQERLHKLKSELASPRI